MRNATDLKQILKQILSQTRRKLGVSLLLMVVCVVGLVCVFGFVASAQAQRGERPGYTGGVVTEYGDGHGDVVGGLTAHELEAAGVSTDSASELDTSEIKADDVVASESPTLEPLLEPLLPKSWENQDWLQIPIWQWVGLFVLVVVGLVLDLCVRFGLHAVVARLIVMQRVKADRQDIAHTLRPLGLFVAAVFWIKTFELLGMQGAGGIIVLAAAKVFAALIGTLSAWRVVHLAAEVGESKARQTHTRFDDVLIPLLRKSAKIFVAVMGLVYAANALNINIMPLVASLGIGGVAFAFAAKDTVENFFGSVAVLLDRPFDIGDWVVVDGTEGTVEAVGFRSTRIRTFYNSQVTVPNANLVRAVVDNYGRRKYRRWKCHVGVQYDTTPDQLLAFTEGIRELVRNHPFTRKDYFQVWVNQFGASSIDVLLYIFHEVPDWSTELRERERLMVDIMRLADALGVQFAFPTQTLHVYQEEHAEHARQHTSPGGNTERRAQVQGIRQAQEIVGSQKWMEQKPGPVVFPAGPTNLDSEDQAFEMTEDTRSAESSAKPKE